MRRLFASWTEFAEYLVFIGVCFAGILHASWRWIAIGMFILFLLSWPRWWVLIAKAHSIDERYRELGRLALEHRLLGMSASFYSKARLVVIVIGGKMLHDGAFLTGAYFFGMAAGWFWGVP
jgi:hypothetical protein